MRFTDMDAPHGDVQAWKKVGARAFADGNFAHGNRYGVEMWALGMGIQDEDATAFADGWEEARCQHIVNANQHDLFHGRRDV